MNEQTSAPVQTEAQKVGIDYAVKLSYNAIDRADLPFSAKRNLLFSVYSFRCLFDNADMLYIHPVLKKYGCTFSCALSEHPSYDEHREEFDVAAREKKTYLPYGGLYIPDGGEYVVRYDAGSPVWQALLAAGKLPPQGDTVPEKLDLYEMVYEIINLNVCDAELKAMWYLTFPFVMLLGAPHDPDLYEVILETLTEPKILDAVLESRYSLYVRDSAAELIALEVPVYIVNFYLPYLSYKSEPDENGVTREEKRFQRWLAAGKFADVFTGTEKLLDSRPDDDGILLCNIAARVSLDPELGAAEKATLLKETLALIESALERGSQKKIFLYYYAGLAHLGLQNPEAALANFFACTELNADFAPAKVMIKALQEKL